MLTTEQIRQHFITFFKQKKHLYVPSAPIVNKEDPNLLFVNAGMNPFTGIFLGHQKAPALRVVNSQPCLRVTGKHNDLEEVGHDTYHHTFFEMLGNWSFGDYFKKEAIAWAWEFLTEWCHLPKERLYATVFRGAPTENLLADDTAFQEWQQYLDPTHIIYADKKDNFWEMGPTGPCGPCTEIHIDLRSEKERAALPGHHLVNQNHAQVIEIWNLVFMQYHRQANQNLELLSKQHVDTGMGLERLAMVLQGKQTTYDTDGFTPLIHWLEAQSGFTYGEEIMTDRAMRVVADHLRAVTFSIADGASPSNQKAGYVIRRILRRAIRYSYSYLGFPKPILYQMVPLLENLFAQAYPSVSQQTALIEKTIAQEEATFLYTLSSGLKRIQTMITHLPPKEKTLEGNALFELYDTFGFPLDLSKTILQEKGLDIDEAGFRAAMQAQKARSKKATTRTTGDWQSVIDLPQHSQFVGYDTMQVPARLVQYRTVQTSKGIFYQIVLDQTPFYPEGGGQVGDTGSLITQGDAIDVIDTQKEHNLIIHYTKKLPKSLDVTLQAMVNAPRREKIKRNHSATHLLHSVLQTILGTHVQQKGSLVAEKGFRFDFTHPKKITLEELQTIQATVNEKIRSNISLQEHRSISMEEAKAMGATALFGEKYGDTVRVVTFDPKFSVELCGGTHVSATGDIGFFHIESEASVGEGIRRIEATTGEGAETSIQQIESEYKHIRNLFLGTSTPVQAIQSLLQAHKNLQKTFDAMEQKKIQETRSWLEGQFEAYDDTYLLIKPIEISNTKALQKILFSLKKVHKKAVIGLGATVDGKAHIMLTISDSLLPICQADKLAAYIAPILKGKSGGKPSFAIANGSNTEALLNTLEQLRKDCIACISK